MEDTRTPLRHDLMYMRCMVRTAIRLHQKRTPKDQDALGVLHDYLTWLAIDAMTDEVLAKSLVHTLARLQEELHAETESCLAKEIDPTATAFYAGVLHGLEQIISFRYGVDLLLGEKLSLREFLESLERTRKRLGL